VTRRVEVSATVLDSAHQRFDIRRRAADGDVVEIVGYEDDPDYWTRLADIPD